MIILIISGILYVPFNEYIISLFIFKTSVMISQRTDVQSPPLLDLLKWTKGLLFLYLARRIFFLKIFICLDYLSDIKFLLLLGLVALLLMLFLRRSWVFPIVFYLFGLSVDDGLQQFDKSNLLFNFFLLHFSTEGIRFHINLPSKFF